MRHLIIGAGPAGVVAAETLRQVDAAATITLVGDEHHAPYSRMAIPYYLTGEIDENGTLLRKEPDHFGRLRIRYRQATVTAVDPAGRSIRLADGTSEPYDRLLIATGSRVLKPPIAGLESPGVEPCWTLEDARQIHRRMALGASGVIIGAGFIGSIILTALHARGVRLTVVETENRMVPRMMNEPAGLMLARWCASRGVRVLTSTRVAGVRAEPDGRLRVDLSEGAPVLADLVVVATGVTPRVEFLADSGIQIGQGLLVDQYLRTSVPDIYAAGDVAEAMDFSSGKRAVHPIQPTATEHGRIAALNMAGLRTPYRGSLIMNVLDTVGLVSHSFGLWMGEPGGEHAECEDRDRFRYSRLEFQDDRLVGGILIGRTHEIGSMRGLIQGRVALGPWKSRLIADPGRIAEAYVARTQTGRVPVASGIGA